MKEIIRKAMPMGFMLCILCAMLMGGCMITEKDYLRGAQRYLKKKYNEEFEGLYGYYSGGYVMMLSPKANPSWKVAVEYEKKHGRVIFHDNYVAFQLKPEIEQMLREIAKPIYGECKVYVQPSRFSLDDSWNKESNLLDYISWGTFDVSLFVFDGIDQKEEKFRRFLDSCLETKFIIRGVNIYYMSKEEFDKVGETAIDYINYEALYIIRGMTVYIREKGYDDIDWREGKGRAHE